MKLNEAKDLASRLRRIPGVRVLGVKSIGQDEKALILQVGKRQVKVTSHDPLTIGKVARVADVHSHGFVRINICSMCYHDLKSQDEHYHEVQGYTGGAQPVCCRCVKRSGGVCVFEKVVSKKRR